MGTGLAHRLTDQGGGVDSAVAEFDEVLGRDFLRRMDFRHGGRQLFKLLVRPTTGGYSFGQTLQVGDDLLGLDTEAGHLCLGADQHIAHDPRFGAVLIELLHLPGGGFCAAHRGSQRRPRGLLKRLEACPGLRRSGTHTKDSAAHDGEGTTDGGQFVAVLPCRPGELAQRGSAVFPVGFGFLCGISGCFTSGGHVGLELTYLGAEDHRD